MTTIATVCSGIGAPDLAADRLGWKHLWFAEIESFPSAVLAHHWPNVPNLGDMTQIADRVRSGEIEAPDVLVGGTPCQSFSVAGLRKGMLDGRGQLTMHYIDLADACDEQRRKRGLGTTWVVWENVPGVYSSHGGKDFGAFLGGIAGGDSAEVPPAGGWGNAGFVAGPRRCVAWRTLDSKYFGVAQRRRRVWLVATGHAVGDARNWACASALFPVEQGVRGDSAPCDETGQGTSADAPGGVGECYGIDEELNATRNGYGVLKHHKDGGFQGSVATWPVSIAPTLNAHFGDKQGLEDQHALNGGGLFVPCTRAGRSGDDER